MCCSDPSPPDYTPIAAANTEAARLAKEAAEKDLAFRQRVYEESKPLYQRLLDITDETTRQQMELGRRQGDIAEEQYRYWQQYFRPVEEMTILDALGGQYLTPEEIQSARASLASGDVGGAYGLTKTAAERAAEQAMGSAFAGVNSAAAQQWREMARLGVDPNRVAAFAANLAGSQSLALADAANRARQGVIGQGYSLRTGAANFGRNMPNTAGQATGLALQAGNSAIGNQERAFNAGLAYPQYVSGATGNIIDSQRLAVQGNNALISAMSNDYANAARRPGLDVGGLLGGVASLYGVMKPF